VHVLFAARSLNGWSLSYVESLDTLWIMGLYEEFDGALAVVANLTFFMPPVSCQFLEAPT
jgi:Glycosyl hydrolase family 47